MAGRADRTIELRRRLRAQRAGLSAEERQAAARHAAAHLGRLGIVLRARCLAIYLPVNGELDPSAAIARALARRARVFAPVIQGDELRFAPLRDDSMLRENRLGILEPAESTYLDPRRLDVVLTPLVAFDDRGTRVGMGGGYYDRCFKFLASRSSWVRPKLIGVGYEFQRVRALERRSWDVPLWAAVTERGVYRF